MKDYTIKSSETAALPNEGAQLSKPVTQAGRRRLPWGTALLLLLVGLLQWPILKGMIYHAGGIEPPASSIAWEQSFSTANQLAESSQKPMLLVFSAAWCPPCNAMKHDVWPDEEVSEVINRSFVPLMVDVDDPENASLAQQYGISGIPAVLVVSPKGEVLRQGGYMSRRAALSFLSTTST